MTDNARRTPYRRAIVGLVGSPSGVIMDIEDAMALRLETSLHEVVVQPKGVGVQRSPKFPVDKKLPRNGETVDVEIIDLGEMFHLTDSVGVVVGLVDLW